METERMYSILMQRLNSFYLEWFISVGLMGYLNDSHLNGTGKSPTMHLWV